MSNKKFIQLKGPFKAGQNILEEIVANGLVVKHVGIQSKRKGRCYINRRLFQLSKTGILEFNNVEIISLSFEQDELDTTLVDCILS